MRGLKNGAQRCPSSSVMALRIYTTGACDSDEDRGTYGLLMLHFNALYL
jgi:hypothetical protein